MEKFLEILANAVVEDFFRNTVFTGKLVYYFWAFLGILYGYSSWYDKYNSRAKKMAVVKSNLKHALKVLGVFTLFFHIIATGYNVQVIIPLPEPLWVSFGACLMIGGIILLAWGRATLNGYWAWSIYEYEDEGELIQEGPYKHIRHPIYLGQILMTLGSVFMVNNAVLLFFPLLTIILNVIRGKNEDKELLIRFPSEFPSYRNRTEFFGFI
jgi:protein-S-isoprenylcysteine O-methyltransferase Ste14